MGHSILWRSKTDILGKKISCLKNFTWQNYYGSIWNMLPWRFSLERIHISNVLHSSRKKIVHSICNGYQFYNKFLNSTTRTKYIDDDGTGVKPKQFFSNLLTGRNFQYGSNVYSSWDKMWDIDMKKTRQKFGRKRKPTRYIYLLWSQSHEDEGNLKLSSCLHDAVINSSPRIGKYVKKMNCKDNANLEEWRIQTWTR